MGREARHQKKERKLAYAVALSLACASFCFGGFVPPPVVFAAGVAADALPTGGKVAAGEATIGAAEVVDGRHQLTIEQTSNRAIIDWQTFNVGSDAAVAFQTWTRDATGARIADPTAMTLNRVAASGGLSTIAGRITSTGIFLLTNPNGVLFADGASVDAAGIVVSTEALDAKAFMSDGRLAFVPDGSAEAAVTVNGTLVAKTDNAQANTALANAVVNIGHPVGTTLSTENNVIRIVADGDIDVGSTGRLQATTTAAYTDGATGETAQRDGTVVLRADADADEAGTVHMAAGGAPQIVAAHAVVQFEPEKSTGGQKDYAAGGTMADTLRQQIRSSDAVVAMLVNDAAQLQAMNTNLKGSYALGRDIDAQGTATWNGDAGFAPIGSETAPFTGVLDGNGYRIIDLTIQRKTDGDVGLFGVTSGAHILQATLVDPYIRGGSRTGGLAGHAKDKTILRGDVVRKRDGAGEGMPRMVEANVIGAGSVGGLVGRLTGSTIRGFSQNASAVKGEQSVGGLAGTAEASSEIFDSSNTGYVSEMTNLHAGQAAGTVQATQGWAGGLVGLAKDKTVIAAREARTATYNAGSVSGGTDGTGGTYLGGLVGYLDGGSIQQAYNTNAPLTKAGTMVGAAAGASPYGNVTGKTNVGGLVGMMTNGSTITTAFNAGNVTGVENVGGLVGTAGEKNASAIAIEQAYSADNNTVVVGADGTAHLTYRDAMVTGRENVGGLVGTLTNGNISQAYSLSRIVTPAGAQGPVGSLIGLQGRVIGKQTGVVYAVPQADAAGNVLPSIGSETAWSSVTIEKRTADELMQSARIAWPQDTWLVKDGATPPLLRAFLRPVSLDRQYRYDGNVHDVTDIPGVYHSAAGTGWSAVTTDGVQTLEELGEPYDAAGWLVMSGAADDPTDASSVYVVDANAFWSPQLGVDTSKNARILIAARPALPPDASGGGASGRGSFGFDASFERPYEFVIRDHRRPRERIDANGWFALSGQMLPRYDGTASFLTLEDTVLRPSGRPYFGGVRLEALGTQPLAAGRMLMAPLPEIVLEKAEDPQEKAGNELLDSE